MQEVIDALYRVFAPVPLDPGVGYCSHCVSQEQVATLHSYPLREIPAEAIHTLLAKGVSTWGDEAYFRHFLPRILELTVAGELDIFSAETYLPSKLVISLAAGTPEEHAAVGRFLTAWWADTLTHYPRPAHPEALYRIITRAGWPGAPLLEMWPQAHPWQLAKFVANEAVDHPPDPIAGWLGSGVPAALLTTAGDATDDPELLDLISRALELLEHDY